MWLKVCCLNQSSAQAEWHSVRSWQAVIIVIYLQNSFYRAILKLCTYKTSVPHLSRPQLLKITILLSFPGNVKSLEAHTGRLSQNRKWLISHHIMNLSQLIWAKPVAKGQCCEILPIALSNSIVSAFHIFLSYLLISGHLDRFCFLNIMNNAAMKIGVKIP